MNLPAKKVEIIGLKEKYKEILEELQLTGVAEVISVDAEKSKKKEGFHKRKQQLEFELAQAKFVKTFLSGYAPKENFVTGLIDSFCPEKKKCTLEELQNLASSETTKETTKKCQEIERSLNEIISKRESLQREIKDVEKFSGISLISSKGLQNFEIFTGSISKEKKDNLLDTLREKSIFFYIEWGTPKEGRDAGFSMVYPKGEKEFVRIAESAGAKSEPLPSSEKAPSVVLKEKKEALKNLKEQEEKEKQRARALSEEIPKFEALIDFYTWELEKTEVFEISKETKNYFYLKAWIKGDELENIEKRLKKITPYLTIEELELEKGEAAPVFVENEGIMKSFEVVTKVYGFPKSNEPDPTPYLAPFFAVAFGLALSDAGYGILLIAFSLLMKKRLEEATDFFNLFMISGGFTIIAGLLTGTFFGTDLFQGLRVMDAMENPIQIMILVSVLGIIQIIAGVLIGLFWNLKQGRKDIAFGPKLGSLVFFGGLGIFFLTESLFALIASIILMMGLNIYFKKADSILQKVAGGFGSLYDLIGYFSDVLSYSRLLALGLATGIIAMTINMIAEISMEMIPVAGLNLLIAGAILIFGHFANLAINSLSSFIHSARLQFVEFFSKFMEGGGEEIKPLRKQGRFIKVVNK